MVSVQRQTQEQLQSQPHPQSQTQTKSQSHSIQRPTAISVRGARVHNLRNISVDIPLGKMIAIAGVSGSGKSSLAMGVLYAEGTRRYLESLSTYTRRRLTSASRPDVDEVLHIPAALALHQRPPVPGVRSTFGTSTELLNSLRLAYSRLGWHTCPRGHYNPPSAKVALEEPIVCSTCGEEFYGPGAEALAFNSDGACPRCDGTGSVREVDESTLVPDESLTLEQGAVRSWGIFGIGWMWHMAGALGVRTDVPFNELNAQEREMVLHGPAVTKMIAIPSKTGKLFDLNTTYRNAVAAVEEAMSGANSEKGIERLNRFLRVQTCPECHGTRCNARVRAILLDSTYLLDGTHAVLENTQTVPESVTAEQSVSRKSGSTLTLPQACALPLSELLEWVRGIPAAMPPELRAMAQQIIDELLSTAQRLIDLGLGYLSLDRASMTLSTGERQRVQLARAVRNHTTGVLYVLDEPSIGLHPANIEGLLGVIRDLLADGNSVIVVDHDVAILRAADWLIEIGPKSGAQGGQVVLSQSVHDVLVGNTDAIEPAPEAGTSSTVSRIVPFMRHTAPVHMRQRLTDKQLHQRIEQGESIQLHTAPKHTVHALDVTIPERALTAVTGVSGSGKTTMVLESLVPAIQEKHTSTAAVDTVHTAIEHCVVVDATPIGANVRSTVATYSGIMDRLRRLFGALPQSRERKLSMKDFSYNTGSLRCQHCDGTGHVVMDVQFLPDVEIECPVCAGSRFADQAQAITYNGYSLPQLLELSVDEALPVLAEQKQIARQLAILQDLGLGYLTLGEATPTLSGGEAQRLKLSTYVRSKQAHTLFVFDEPSIGLHPADVQVLLHVLDQLVAQGATVLYIEHDLDMIANADWVIDMGPGGGEAGGRIVASCTPDQLMDEPQSLTGQYLKQHLTIYK